MFCLLISFIHGISTLLSHGDNMVGKQALFCLISLKKSPFFSASVKLKLLPKKGEGSQGQQTEMKGERTYS